MKIARGLSRSTYIAIRVCVVLIAVASIWWLATSEPKVRLTHGPDEGISCTAVAWRQMDDVYPLYSELDGFSPDDLEGGLNRYSEKLRDELTQSIQNHVLHACDMARDDRRMQIILVAIVGAVVFLSIPKPRPPRPRASPSEFDAMQAKLNAMYKRMYAKEGAQGRFAEDRVEQIRKTLREEGAAPQEEGAALREKDAAPVESEQAGRRDADAG